MAGSFAIDTDSDVVRGVAMGLAFLVGLALNLDPARRTLALAVFGGGAVAFFGLATLAAVDDDYGGPQLRWYLFAAWGVLLFTVGVWTESAVGGIGGIVVAVYAAVRAWLFDALDEPEGPDAGESAAEPDPWDDPNPEATDGAHPAARQPVTPDHARRAVDGEGVDAVDVEGEGIADHEGEAAAEEGGEDAADDDGGTGADEGERGG